MAQLLTYNKSAENTMSSGEMVNPGFVADDFSSQNSVARIINKKDSKNDVYTVELQDVNNSKEQDGDYNPYLHRKVEHPTTNSETLLHLLKGSLGTGILAMPNAFHHSGYLVGTVGTLIIGTICTYCIHILINCEYELCKRKKVPSLTYPATAEAACLEGPNCLKKCATASIHIVNVFLLIYQLGICCVYIVFIAANLKSAADIYITELDLEIWMLILLVPLVFINYVRNLKFLAPFSTVANGITVVCFGIILYYVIQGGPTFENRHAFGPIKEFPLFFGTVLFALEAIGVIMPLENEMKTPKKFGSKFGVLNIGMASIIFLYMGMGLLGYMTYGADSLGSITLNIPKDDILAQVVKVLFALAIFITYGLQCYVAVDITWNEYLLSRMEKNNHKLFWEYVVRTVIVLVTFLLAVAVPKLDLFISLFGALCLSALGIAFPAIIETSTYWHQMEGPRFYWNVLKNTVLVIFGICGLVVGTYTSLSDIVKEFGR